MHWAWLLLGITHSTWQVAEGLQALGQVQQPATLAIDDAPSMREGQQRRAHALVGRQLVAVPLWVAAPQVHASQVCRQAVRDGREGHQLRAGILQQLQVPAGAPRGGA